VAGGTANPRPSKGHPPDEHDPFAELLGPTPDLPAKAPHPNGHATSAFKALATKAKEILAWHHNGDHGTPAPPVPADDIPWLMSEQSAAPALPSSVLPPAAPPPPAPDPDDSPLMSGQGSRRGVFVPDWAMAITPDKAERELLGYVDYWLGYETPEGRELHRHPRSRRAKGWHLHHDQYDGTIWYASTYRQIGDYLGNTTDQMYRLASRLRRKKLLFAERCYLGDWRYGVRLRLNWPQIEATFAAAQADVEDEE
jgi:hypothetical protein